MSRRRRERQDARPWRNPSPTEPAIDWQALAAERQQREQSQQQPKGPQQ
ncbi:hypothetical protein PEC18_18600 [Paucibacter sp. O1-1]|nr:hypothetical protein [Paucibacter sp. O1-1]MDA3827808.1 hypothetical protein [Paucibacter sp. O1-1]